MSRRIYHDSPFSIDTSRLPSYTILSFLTVRGKNESPGVPYPTMFVGRQVPFDVDGDEFFVDLLFFHLEQLRYVVVELKAGKFKPEYAGQLGSYVELVEGQRPRSHLLLPEPPGRQPRRQPANAD